MGSHCTNPEHEELRDCEAAPAACTHRDDADIKLEGGPRKRNARTQSGIVTSRSRTVWQVAGKDVLVDMGDGTFDIVNWSRPNLQQLERLYQVIGQLLTDKTQTEA